MTQERWTVPENLGGERLDKAIAALCEGASRSRVKKAVEAGAVRINGRRAPKGATVAPGDEITVADFPLIIDGDPAVPEPDQPLDVRYETKDVLIVEKPAKMPCHPLNPGETGTLANVLVGKYPELAGIGYNAREPGLVHRIDGDTSGLVVVARTAAAFETLRTALKEHQLKKKYLLICPSENLPDSGTIEFPLANHPKDNRRVYACIHPRDVARNDPRPATTHFKVLERTVAKNGFEWALVEAEAPFALRHQIRAHFAALGHPLAGDELYGGAAVPGLERHALHASFVGHNAAPAFAIASPLPADLAAILKTDDGE